MYHLSAGSFDDLQHDLIASLICIAEAIIDFGQYQIHSAALAAATAHYGFDTTIVDRSPYNTN